MSKRYLPGLIAVCLPLLLFGQQHSHNGWVLPVKDTLSVLMLFVEVQYDTLPHLEDLPQGKSEWPKGQLPAYADSLFHPIYTPTPSAKLSYYYQEISLGNLVVLGDYMPELFKVNYSDMMTGGLFAMYRKVAEQIASMDTVVTRHGFGLKHFDRWLRSPGRGLPILPSGPDFEGVDHVMLFTRNYHTLPMGNGQASGGSMGIIGGKPTDSYSVFSGGHNLPFPILKHELNHLFLGGNNFHSGGGNASNFASYFMGVQGGWSMMGAANSSLLTCSAWDRYRLGWKATGNEYLISARNQNGMEVNTDLDATRADGQGIYILRDFVTTGDALRIKLPFIPSDKFPQWIWVESHATQKVNGSPFDRFMYDEHECTSATTPGLFMFVQADAETKEGKNIYSSVMADYLRPLPANGMYDIQWSKETLQLPFCVNTVAYHPYTLDRKWENPLTGNHEQEVSMVKRGGDPLTADRADMHVPMTRSVGSGEYERLNFHGNGSHAFHMGGNRKLGIGTNPASANMYTYVNIRRPRKPDQRNNDTIHLNGVSVTLLKFFTDGSAMVEVRFDDHLLDAYRRWAAPAIVLHNHNPSGPDLLVSGHLVLDRPRALLRFDNPDTSSGGILFSDPTTFIVEAEAQIEMQGVLEARERSRIIMGSGSEFTTQRKSRILLKDASEIYFGPGATFSGRGRIRISKGARVMAEDASVYRILRKRSKGKRRVFYCTPGSQT